jgi:hypothetical protein
MVLLVEASSLVFAAPVGCGITDAALLQFVILFVARYCLWEQPYACRTVGALTSCPGYRSWQQYNATQVLHCTVIHGVQVLQLLRCEPQPGNVGMIATAEVAGPLILLENEVSNKYLFVELQSVSPTR